MNEIPQSLLLPDPGAKFPATYPGFIMPYRDGKHSLEVRWETFNVTNTAKFDAYTASLDVSVAGTFGKYTDQLTQPRVMQFGLRYEF